MKRSVLTEASGGPLAAVVSGADTHDTRLLSATLDAVVVDPPQPTEEKPQHLCLDKGYDNPTGTRRLPIMGIRLTFGGLVWRSLTEVVRSGTRPAAGWSSVLWLV